MPRVGLSPAGVVDAALELVDRDGAESLTLGAVAKHVGVAAPSLYKHVPSLAALRDRLAARVMDELRHRVAAAVLGRSRDDAVRAAMNAYRAYVVEHPRRYAMFPQVPGDDPVLAEPAARLLDVLLAVLGGYGLRGSAAIHAARCLRACAHGFAALQAAGGFGLPEDLDTSYRHLVDGLLATIAGLAADG